MRPLQSGRERLSQDYQLALIVLVTAIAVVFVTPFAIFRFLEGTYVVAIADGIAVAVAVCAAIYAWRSGRTRGAGIVISVILIAAVVGVSMIVGLDGAFWIYPVILFVFYLAPPTLALGMTVAALLTFVAREWNDPGSMFLSSNQMAGFLVTGFASAIFSFFFARHSIFQREQLTRWATRDPLTGLYNRRSLNEELKIALADHARHGVSYGLIILDLDDFKMVNDEAGHAAGDQVLRDLAALIRSTTRVGDRAFRYGGDEFVIILPKIDHDGLKKIADGIVTSVRRSLRCLSTGITTSVGATLLRDVDTQESWNQRADRALYTAKEAGRNTAVVE